MDRKSNKREKTPRFRRTSSGQDIRPVLFIPPKGKRYFTGYVDGELVVNEQGKPERFHRIK